MLRVLPLHIGIISTVCGKSQSKSTSIKYKRCDGRAFSFTANKTKWPTICSTGAWTTVYSLSNTTSIERKRRLSYSNTNSLPTIFCKKEIELNPEHLFGALII